MPKNKKSKAPPVKSTSKKQQKDVKPESDSNEGCLKPVRPRIGESSDNLKQRADWFQKRTGKS